MTTQPSRQCVECGAWFFPGQSNETGQSHAGQLTERGPVCNPCLRDEARARDGIAGKSWREGER
jgi:hypothetical protein